MSNYIVLVKQAPDVSQITDNAFDPETGTLIRTRLASVINELDAQALAFAMRGWRKIPVSFTPSLVCNLTRSTSMFSAALAVWLAPISIKEQIRKKHLKNRIMTPLI